jgi:hypothetical protein
LDSDEESYREEKKGPRRFDIEEGETRRPMRVSNEYPGQDLDHVET